MTTPSTPSTPISTDRQPTARHAVTPSPAPIDGADEPMLVAEGLALITRRGRVFGPLSFTVDHQQLTVITGSSGSGRSALLLALTGRMSGVTGGLLVAGHDGIARPRVVRSVTAVARIAGLVDLEPQLTVGESITERSLIDGINPETGARTVRDLVTRLGLDLPHSALVADLPGPQRTLLCVLLAAVRPSKLIVLDDLDRSASGTEQIMIIDTLGALCANGHTVVATLTDPEPAAPSTRVVRLSPTTQD